ncbi:PLC-like phosphodiesterase [Xylaria arbuscula]|nr:PLC-like phosphodiesterase [Xylaria arbuscula]
MRLSISALSALGALTHLFAHNVPGVVASGSGSSLAQFALDKVLKDARDILGIYSDPTSDTASISDSDTTSISDSTSGSTINTYGHGHGYAYNKYARWMADLPDSTPLAHLTIPGVHDAATWNYTQSTQDSLINTTTRCDGTTPNPARVYQCQQLSILSALESGIRFFDLRFALDPLGARLVFWHGPALLSAGAGVEDVLFGFYAWLDSHPEEMVLLSFQYEGGTRVNATSDAVVQGLLVEALTGEVARGYVASGRGVLGTLGDVRGKIVLFRRFDLDQLPPEYEATIPGLHMSPTKWLDNSPTGFELVFNETNPDGTGTAYIEDFYHPDNATTIAGNIEAKFAAVETHLREAVSGEHPDSLFVTFTSGTHVEISPAVYPDVMALGSGGGGSSGRGLGRKELAVSGVNERLLSLFRELKGKRLGIVVMDFFEEPEGLIDLLLGF